MTITTLNIAEPFFGLRHIHEEESLQVNDPAIVLNIAEKPLRIENQNLRYLHSTIVMQTTLSDVAHAVVIERVSEHRDEEALLEEIRARWPLAFDVRGEERLRGKEHYMSPKTRVGNIGLSFYHAASVPLNVGLHKEHPFCPVPGFREVHTQIVGVGKMQQFRENDITTLYLEEYMAPGNTHRPMYNDEGNYPWHQYETVTPGIFMSLEMLPDGVTP